MSQENSSPVGFSQQLLPEQLVQVKEKGFVSVINNRPEFEDPEQPSQANIALAAETAGLEYHFLPVVSGQITQENIEDFAKIYNQAAKPVLMFCRSGKRSQMLFQSALQQNLITID